MRHLILIPLLSLLTQTAFAQYKSGKVVYKVIPPKSVIELRDTTHFKSEAGKRVVVRNYNRLNTHSPHLELIMEFNSKEALAKMRLTMDNDSKPDLNSAALWARFNRNYYTNFLNLYQLHEFELAGRDWLVRYDKDISKWIITNETKEIHGYTCYKATTPIILKNGEDSEKIIEAWFTPEIPFQFGPTDIYGLPGLVLEANRNNFTYYASEIKLNKSEKSINKPKGKVINNTQYNDEMNSKVNKMRP